MPITDLLERNSKLYGDEVALVEMNPEIQEEPRVTWREYELIQPTTSTPYRREITWSVFDEKANRVANLLRQRGIRKGQKVAILLMNCLEWLPIYFGILKTGAIAVPLNFRYTAGEIEYCLRLADADVLFFGPEFIGRVEDIVPKISREKILFFVGDSKPSFAESYSEAVANCSSAAPKVLIEDTDEAAIYFPPAPPASPRPFCWIIPPFCSPPEWKPCTMKPPTATCSCASRPCTTPARKCTGSAPCSPAAGP